MSKISENVKEFKRKIESICLKCNINPGDITVLAATKYANVDEINEAISAGITNIGENKIQDGVKKFPAILPVKRHFIGHLQTNKVKDAVKLFDLIESVDSLKLAKKINDESLKLGKKTQVLLEVNIARDPNKFGLKLDEVEILVPEVMKLPNVIFCGLMSIVPFAENLNEVRPYFRRMKDLFEKFAERDANVKILSMGMSNDYMVAIEEGATEVRIGSLLFKN